MEFRVHEQVSLVHVFLNKCFVLLGISTANDKIILARNEPDEFLEPEHFPLHGSDLRLFQPLEISDCCLLSLFNGDISCSFGFDFLLVGLFLDFKILLYVKLSRYAQVYVYFSYLVEIV